MRVPRSAALLVALVLPFATSAPVAHAMQAVHNEGQTIVVDFGHPNPVPRVLGESGSVYTPPELVGTSYLLNGDVIDEASGICLAADCSVVRLFLGTDLLVNGQSYDLVFQDQSQVEHLGGFVAVGATGDRPQLLDVSATQTTLSVSFDRPMLHDSLAPHVFDRPTSYDSPEDAFFSVLRQGATRALDAEGRTVTFTFFYALAAGERVLQIPPMYDADGRLSEAATVTLVVADDGPPSLRAAMSGPSGTRSFVLAFSEPMDEATATDLAHYAVSKRVLTAETAPAPFPDGSFATCTFIGCTFVTIFYPAGFFQACFDEPHPAPAYRITVSGVLDAAGNAMGQDPAATESLCAGRDTPS